MNDSTKHRYWDSEKQVWVWPGDAAGTDLVSVLEAFTNFVQNERVRCYNEGLNEGYEAAAKFLENGRFLHDDAPPKRFATEAAAGIRRLISS